MTLQTKTILKAARALLSDPAKWTKDVAARNYDGEEVDTDDAAATCFCAIGALWHFGAPRRHVACVEAKALEAALPRGFEHIADYNDDPTTTHADILALFDRAILDKA